MSSSLQWGTTPATPPSATLDPANGLQPIVNAIAAAASGGVIDLGDGTYYADPANPATPLTIPAGAYNLRVRGKTAQGTIVGSPILCQAGKLGLSDMHIDPPAGSAYGLKIYNGGSPFLARHMLERIIVGDRAQVAANGPTNGLHIDGAGIIQATECTFAFCAQNGLLADSTGAEPNTTLQFDMCSFVGNPQYGIKLLGSCGLAEFRGGNSEQNGSAGAAYGELYCDSMNNAHFTCFDFETNQVIDNACTVTTCNPVVFDDCSWTTGVGKATRALIAQSSAGVSVRNPRMAGWTNVGVIRFDENCTGCAIHLPLPSSGCWVEDYSR